MTSAILTLSDRGTLTIPKSLRKILGTKHVTCRYEDNKLILEPLQSREEFMAELDAIERNWKKHGGGLTLKEIKKKYHL